MKRKMLTPQFHLLFLFVRFVCAVFAESSLSPSLMPSANSSLSSGETLSPQKIQLNQTMIISTCGSVSFLSLLYYWLNSKKSKSDPDAVIEEEKSSANEITNEENLQTLGIASPRTGDDWVKDNVLSVMSLNEDQNDVRHIIHDRKGAKHRKNNLRVTFSGVDIGWARFDEECPHNYSELYAIKEGQVIVESIIEI